MTPTYRTPCRCQHCHRLHTGPLVVGKNYREHKDTGLPLVPCASCSRDTRRLAQDSPGQMNLFPRGNS